MRNTLLLTCFFVLGLSACTQSKLASADRSKVERNDIYQPLGERCEDAKYQLKQTVEEGQLSDLKELKRNIELYCVWRRN